MEDNADLKIVSPLFYKDGNTHRKGPTCVLVPVNHSVFSLSSLDPSYQNILPQSFQNIDDLSRSLFPDLKSSYTSDLIHNFRIYL